MKKKKKIKRTALDIQFMERGTLVGPDGMIYWVSERDTLYWSLLRDGWRKFKYLDYA